MMAAKAFFVVNAGIIPDQPMREHYRAWGYDSQDYEADRKRAQGETSTLEQHREAALAYARDLMNPAQLNWVHVEFVWV
jgi:hypothetical protein